MTAPARPRRDDGTYAADPSRQDTVRDLVARYEAGATINALVAATGIPRTTVTDMLHDGGATMRPAVQPRIATPQQVTDMVARYLGDAPYTEPQTIRAIAVSVGLAYGTVRKELGRAGVLRSRSGGAHLSKCRATHCTSRAALRETEAELAAAVNALNEAVAELATLRRAISPYVIECPRCSAAAGDRCRTLAGPDGKGGRLTETHTERLVEAFYALPPVPPPMPDRAAKVPGPRVAEEPVRVCEAIYPRDNRIKCRKQSDHYPASYHRAGSVSWG